MASNTSSPANSPTMPLSSTRSLVARNSWRESSFAQDSWRLSEDEEGGDAVGEIEGAVPTASVPRSAAIEEGVALLKAGSVVIKHGRHGRPRPVLFTLSSDESLLSWEPRTRNASFSRVAQGMRRVSVSKERPRRVCLEDALSLLVGRESEVFHRRANESSGGGEGLSLSLVLKLPAALDEGVADEHPTDGRPTLDLSFEDDETFGLWVAALRALIPPPLFEKTAAPSKPSPTPSAAAASAVGTAATLTVEQTPTMVRSELKEVLGARGLSTTGGPSDAT